jgi:hypothetical protein
MPSRNFATSRHPWSALVQIRLKITGVLPSAIGLLRVPNSLFGLIPGRVTYLVDSEGIVRGVYDSQINATGHVRAALAALNRLRQNP